MSDQRRSLKSVERVGKILDVLRREDAVRLSEVGAQLDISLGTLHTYLDTLRREGFVEREGQQYRLGPELLTLGETYRNNSVLYRAGRSEVKQLAGETEESVHLITERRDHALVIYEEFGPRAVGTKYHQQWREQTHAYLHCTGAGKAILAHLPEQRREIILDEGDLVALTDETITDRARLREELARTRERGFALADGEEISGVRAVGAPIYSPEDEVLGAISLTAAANRLEGDRFRERIPSRLQQAANIIEVNIRTGDLAY
jgi:DNA-binding IclR family transcriptional regulator